MSVVTFAVFLGEDKSLRVKFEVAVASRTNDVESVALQYKQNLIYMGSETLYLINPLCCSL